MCVCVCVCVCACVRVLPDVLYIGFSPWSFGTVQHLACLLATLAKDCNFTHPHTDLWPWAHKVVGAESSVTAGELFVKMYTSRFFTFMEQILLLKVFYHFFIYKHWSINVKI